MTKPCGLVGCARVLKVNMRSISMRRLLLAALLTFSPIGGAALAADAASVPPASGAATVPAAKIGVVDMQTIATDSDASKAAKAQLESKYGKDRAALEKQGKDLKKQAEGLKNPKSSNEKKAAFFKAQQKLEADTKKFLGQVEKDEIKLRQDMVTLVFSATYEVARAKGFNFVVDVTAGGVLYADPSMDITQDVLAEVNRLYNEKKPAEPEKPAATNTNPAEQPKKK